MSVSGAGPTQSAPVTPGALNPAGPVRLGRYELITRIGQGGMADVQLAIQRGPHGFEKLVVVKLIHDALATQKAFVDMLLDEARVAALVKHPNVVDIYDLGESDGRYFIAMEYLEGEPLLAVLRAGREGKRLDPLSTGRLVADAAEGLDAAHELRTMAGEPLELVHHDVSLGNIVTLYNGQVKLVDFGVAKATANAKTHDKVQGKFSYMAPEKLRGAPGDRRSDIFSLGCVMWESLTLKRLFRGATENDTIKSVLTTRVPPPSTVNPDVPSDYDSIVMRALDRDPSKRQMTAKELAVEIEELLRKRGYGAKNDKIAKYMQETFREHIDARKKLVQEVANKGVASAEVLDAAFSDPLFPAGSPLTPPAKLPQGTDPNDGSGGSKFSPPPPPVWPARTKTSSIPIPVAALESADSSKPTTIEAPPLRWEGSDTSTEISGPPLEVLEMEALERTAEETPDAVDQTANVREGALAQLRSRFRALPPPKRHAVIAAGCGVVLAVLVVIELSSSGGGAATPTASVAEPRVQPTPVAPPDPKPVPVAVAPTPDPVATPEPAATIDPPTSAPHHPAHTPTTPPHVAPIRHPPTPAPTPAPAAPATTGNANDLFKQGLQAYVKGDLKTALTEYKRATQSNSGFAPAWRGLGLVYQKLGDRGPAKAAFGKYLALAPNASDADSIRRTMAAL